MPEAAADPADVVCGLLARGCPAPPSALPYLRVKGSSAPRMVAPLAGLIRDRECPTGHEQNENSDGAGLHRKAPFLTEASA
jgi:hypothetical protein